MSSPELRIDQLSGLPVILAPGRAGRPEGFRSKASEPKGPASCPFCEGREERTPPEVHATRARGGEPNSAGWTTRVVPNLYPALDQEGDGATGGGDPTAAVKGDAGAFAAAGDPLLESRRSGDPNLFVVKPARGAHEVIVNSPEHATAMAELSAEQLGAAVETWRARMRAHADASYVQLIVNEGG